LLENGADGNTRSQLQQQLLEQQGATDEVLSVYRALEKNLNIDESKTRLHIANGVFHDQHTQLKQEYQRSAHDCLDAQIQEADFQNQEETRQKINRFISEKTENKIPELFKKGSLQQDAKIVLANAIYLKAAWEKTFNKQQTQNQAFYRQGRQQDPQQVPFMKSQGQYRHSADEKLQVVELKYEKAQLSMYVLLPKQRDGIRELEQQLNGDRLREILSRLQTRQVQVELPKFQIRSPQNLKPTLSKMGLDNLFSSQADLSRLSEEKLHVSQAVHEAYIKIDEDGTEAAAATGVAAAKAAVVFHEDPTPFKADHPFLYTIVHNPTGAVVFIGKVNQVQDHE